MNKPFVFAIDKQVVPASRRFSFQHIRFKVFEQNIIGEDRFDIFVDDPVT